MVKSKSRSVLEPVKGYVKVITLNRVINRCPSNYPKHNLPIQNKVSK